MKTDLTKKMEKWLLFLLCTSISWSCSSNNKKEATNTAKSFLKAYYKDLNFPQALLLSSNSSHAAINEHAEIISLNPYASEETPDIVLKSIELNSEDNTASCIYTCNRIERTLPLRKFGKQWLVNLEGRTVESERSVNEIMELPSSNTNGFASSTSGEVTYKKRCQKNK
ncbi:MAG: hypothetical protein NC324_08285 [Bacteroides sp.]|nr:hypothetical protein [Bacteroides sp.]MCM1086372.1 hypothetical protein [Bacteroides sp.]MCM1169916.1 hypothetical protein [Bacteroides sp.]